MTGFKELTQDRRCPGTCRGCGLPRLCQLPTLHRVCGFTPIRPPDVLLTHRARPRQHEATWSLRPPLPCCPRAGKETSQCYQAQTEG